MLRFNLNRKAGVVWTYRRYYDAHVEERRASAREHQRERRLREPERVYQQKRAGEQRLRVKAIAVLTTGKKPACARCGFDDLRALQIDHVFGGGMQHRRRRTMRGVLQDVIRSGGRDGAFQLLCANCNWIKRYEMRHERESVGRVGVEPEGVYTPPPPQLRLCD